MKGFVDASSIRNLVQRYGLFAASCFGKRRFAPSSCSIVFAVYKTHWGVGVCGGECTAERDVFAGVVTLARGSLSYKSYSRAQAVLHVTTQVFVFTASLSDERSPGFFCLLSRAIAFGGGWGAFLASILNLGGGRIVWGEGGEEEGGDGEF